MKVSICPLCLIPLNWLFPRWPGTLSACVQAVNIDLSDNFPKQCSLPSFFLNHRHISIVFIRHNFSQSLTQPQPCWNLTYVSFGWRKYLLNTSANFVDGLVFDVKVNLDIDIDFDVMEVMWDFEDDIVSFFCQQTKVCPIQVEEPSEKCCAIRKRVLWISEYFWIKNCITHAEGRPPCTCETWLEGR